MAMLRKMAILSSLDKEEDPVSTLGVNSSETHQREKWQSIEVQTFTNESPPWDNILRNILFKSTRFVWALGEFK